MGLKVSSHSRNISISLSSCNSSALVRVLVWVSIILLLSSKVVSLPGGHIQLCLGEAKEAGVFPRVLPVPLLVLLTSLTNEKWFHRLF